jgi:hypothetical protein
MDFINSTKLPAAWTLGFDREGVELVVAVIKATFMIPEPGSEPLLAEDQVKLTEADEFTAEPGLSAPLRETDFAHRKPFCDVLLNGSVYAPGGRPVRQTVAAMRVGAVQKTLAVKGSRVWQRRLLATVTSEPERFVRLPISYDVAYGGVDASNGDPNNVKTFLSNPVGRGYAPNEKDLDGRPLPNTEEIGNPVVNPKGNYRPMSFGVVGRSWTPRAGFAGTYDQRWLDEQAPFWPRDFDLRYFQSAPSDQQMPYARGGEEISLRNVTPGGSADFKLPYLYVPLLFIPYQRQDRQVDPLLDTILFEPDLARFTMTWRATVPMRHSCFDIKEVVVGEPRPHPYRMRRPGNKPRKTLAELVRLRRQRSRSDESI